jgi:hypothetical protein
MLSTRNSGKYLSGEWARERERCAQDRDQFSAEDQAFYEISGQSPGMGDRERIEETMTIEGVSLDPSAANTRTREIDIRDRPEVGH